MLEARVDVFQERVAALPRLDERRAALGRERLWVEGQASQAYLKVVVFAELRLYAGEFLPIGFAVWTCAYIKNSLRFE